MKIIDFRDSIHYRIFDFLRNTEFQVANDSGRAIDEYETDPYIGVLLPMAQPKKFFSFRRRRRVFLGVLSSHKAECGKMLFRLHDKNNLSIAESLCSRLEEEFGMVITIEIIHDEQREECSYVGGNW